MRDRAGRLSDLEAELRALGREIDVPAVPDLTADVRRRLERAEPLDRPWVGRHRGGSWRLRWRIAVPVMLALLAILAVTPPGQAVITHVFRFAGIELHQEPGPVRTPVSSPSRSPSLPGERLVSLDRARRLVTFPILVPAAFGVPEQVAVSDGGRVASLIYSRTSYGEVRVDEFDGHADTLFFKKFATADDATLVRVAGRTALWVEGPHEIIYVRRDGTTSTASARLTTGNTLIWDTGRVALRLEGAIDKGQAITIATATRS
jgi:hypothetical protein